jgi:hypothetical protein
MTNVFDIFFKKFAYKFSKGYPDMKNEQDVLLLESLLNKLGTKIKIEEANLAGSATGYDRSTGAFEKYITDALRGHINNKTPYKIIKDTKAGIVQNNGDFVLTNDIIKQGEEITISSDKVDDLVLNNKIYYVPIKNNGKDYYVALNAILKPTGKNVSKLAPNLNQKSDPKIYHQFTPGHPQEGKVVILFIEQTDKDWNFICGENELKNESKVTYLGDPIFKGVGYPKSDVQINLTKPPYGLDENLRISLKADNATYVENWMLPSRGEQIFGSSKLKDIVLGAHKALMSSTNLRSGDGLFSSALKSNQIMMFIKDKPSTLGTKAPSILKEPLSKEESKEAYTGNKKFGDIGSANYFYKGKDPDTICEFLSNLKSFDKNMDDLSDLYISLRGSNESGKGNVRIFYWDDNLNQWVINSLWVNKTGIKETKDPKTGQLTYS